MPSVIGYRLTIPTDFIVLYDLLCRKHTLLFQMSVQMNISKVTSYLANT